MSLALIAVGLNSLFVLGFFLLLFVDGEYLFNFLYFTFWQADPPYVYIFSILLMLLLISGIGTFIFSKKRVSQILLNIGNGLAMLLCTVGALGLVVAFGLFWWDLSIYLGLYGLFGASLALLNLDKKTFITVEA
jgi:hypothetical protein